MVIARIRSAIDVYKRQEHARVPNHAEQVLLITVTNAKEDSESQILRVNDIRKERVDHGLSLIHILFPP